jgi:hypothetical protein
MENPSNISIVGEATAVAELSSNHPEVLGQTLIHRRDRRRWRPSSTGQPAPLTARFQSQLNPVVRR